MHKSKLEGLPFHITSKRHYGCLRFDPVFHSVFSPFTGLLLPNRSAHNSLKCLESIHCQAGEITHWLSALDALPGHPTVIPSTQVSSCSGLQL